MSFFSILQPNLMTTDELRSHLKMRFPNQNMIDMQRDQLLKLYSMYATPKAKRLNAISDVEMEYAGDKSINTEKGREKGLKRSRNQTITAPTVETVTNACKKICLMNTERVSTQKRHCETSEPMDSETGFRTSIQTKRKKITWP